jgi:hypothetical protein
VGAAGAAVRGSGRKINLAPGVEPTAFLQGVDANDAGGEMLFCHTPGGASTALYLLPAKTTGPVRPACKTPRVRCLPHPPSSLPNSG